MHFLKALFLTTLLQIVFFAAHAHALSVNQVRFGMYPDRTRMVLDLDRTSEFKVFTLAAPYRLVIDLPHFEWKSGYPALPKGSAIKAIRHGNISPGISRVVLDLQKPAEIRSAFTLPAQGAKPNRLVIDFNAIDEARFWAGAKDKSFGTLSLNPDTPPDIKTTTNIPKNHVPRSPVIKPLIVIDPGHGGVDPGAIGANKAYEKHVVLKIAKDLKRELEKTGQYRVLMTRENDVFIKLRDRVKFARNHNADLFVSIHADSIGKTSVSGTSFYTLSEKASDAQTAKLAARENRADQIAGLDLSTEDEDVANILMDLAMRDTTNQAKFLANKLTNTFRHQGVKTLKTAHRHAGFAVLKAPDVPSILVETGFMSNPNEARLLQTAAHRKKIAKALHAGIDAYFEQVRKNQRP